MVYNKKDRFKKILGTNLVRFLLIFIAFFMVVPLLWSVVSSFKTNTEYMLNAYALPKSLQWDNYARAWAKSNIGRGTVNSLVVVVLKILLLLVTAVPCSYALSRFRFFGSKLLLTIFMCAVFISGNYIIVPLFLEMKSLHMLNSLPGLSVVYTAFTLPFSIFLLSGYMRDIPHDYEEAAEIDGCNTFQTFMNVIVPISRSGISTITILGILNAWNEYPIALVTLTSDAKRTLPVGLANLYVVQQYATDWGALYAALVIALVPTIIVFLIGEKQLLSGLSVGGLKG
ncbi:MAG: carbohydrate ABC transporter permease [Eubacteriales bacterium]|nr:carbohydrate ABC transporter permease [Eubacteriales bacterium]